MEELHLFGTIYPLYILHLNDWIQTVAVDEAEDHSLQTQTGARSHANLSFTPPLQWCAAPFMIYWVQWGGGLTGVGGIEGF